MLYAELSAFGESVKPSWIRREDALYVEQDTGELPGTFGRGTRFYSTFAVWVEVLGCNVISGWTRREID